MTDKLREALELIKALDVPVNIVDVMDSTAREAVEIAKAALAQQDAQEPLITVESSLRFRLDCTKEQLEAAERENAELRGRLRGALAQQDAQAVPHDQLPHGWSVVQVTGSTTNVWPMTEAQMAEFAVAALEKESAMLNAAPTPPAQQDAQVVSEDEIVAAWKSGMTVQYFVTIGHDDEWTDYTNPTPPDTSGTRLAWRVKPGQRSNAAPTPPSQQDAQTVPQGWKLTPVEPTPEMRKAAADAWIDCGDRLILNKAAAAVRAGIAAAPTPPAQQDAQAVPQGWKLVPVEPSEEMCAEGLEDEGDTIMDGKRYARALYSAMLKAAPTPPAQEKQS